MATQPTLYTRQISTLMDTPSMSLPSLPFVSYDAFHDWNSDDCEQAFLTDQDLKEFGIWK